MTHAMNVVLFPWLPASHPDKYLTFDWLLISKSEYSGIRFNEPLYNGRYFSACLKL